MRKAIIVVVAAVAAFTTACGSDGDAARDAISTVADTDVTSEPPDEPTEANETTRAPATPAPGQSPDPSTDPEPSTTTEPDSASTTTPPTVAVPEQTEPTLGLLPAKTTVPSPASDGPPAGSDTSIFPGRIDVGLDPFVELARDDLAARLGVAADEIEVISAVLVTWPDSSLGCPEPGMSYLQALEDGTLIELGHDGRVHRYHSGGNRAPFLCDRPLANPPVPSDGI